MKNRYDRLFLVILAGVILLLFLYQHFAGSKGSYILVTQNGEKIGEYSLLENQTFVVTDENHSYNTIVIENGQVSGRLPGQIMRKAGENIQKRTEYYLSST